MNLIKNEIGREIFLFPAPTNGGYIVYAPLKGVSFWVDDDYGNLINSFLSSNISIESIEDEKLRNRLQQLLSIPSKQPSPASFQIKNHLILILSELCNFGCKYCYAQNAHCNDVILWEDICSAIDALAQKSGDIMRVTFIGGGEPTVTYKLLQQTVEFAERKASALGKQVVFSLTTNASLITRDHALWLLKHHFRVSASFDILPDIQNAQRPLAGGKESFECVDAGIKNLIAVGIHPRFRATITQENVDLMEKMVEFSTINYPSVKYLHFEHVSDNIPSLNLYLKNYIEHFFNAKELAAKAKIHLTNSILTSFTQLKDVFCEGEFCVVPNGDFVTCHRVSSNKDLLYDRFRVGRISGSDKFDGIINVGQTQVYRPPECNHCFAKWHCAGGCAYNRLFYDEHQMELLCSFTKEMISRELATRLGLPNFG